MVADEIPCALIMEDDARWDADFWEVAAAVAQCGWRYDAALLHRAKRAPGRRLVCNLTERHQLVRHRRLATCSTAYLVTIAGAQKLMRQFAQIIAPMDLIWRDHWHTDMAFYEVVPGAATTSGADSQIGARRTKRTLPQILRRKMWKIYFHYKRREFHRKHKPKRVG